MEITRGQITRGQAPSYYSKVWGNNSGPDPELLTPSYY